MSEIGFGNHKLLFQQILTLHVELNRLLPSQSGLPTVLHMSGQLKGDNRTLMFQELLVRPWKHFSFHIETFEKHRIMFHHQWHHQGKMLLPSGKRSHSDIWKIPHLSHRKYIDSIKGSIFQPAMLVDPGV